MRRPSGTPSGRGTAPDLFPETKVPRARRRVLMHVTDAGSVDAGAAEDLGKPLCRMRCARCGAESDWLIFDTVSEAKRGVPCDACNAVPTEAARS